MKIKFLSGAKSGTTEHINNQTGALLIAAGMAEEVPLAVHGSAGWLADRLEQSRATEPQLTPAKVIWSIIKGSITERWAITARCSRPNCSGFFFDGDPNIVVNNHGQRRGSLEQQQFIHSCSGTAPEKVPADICTEYRAKKKSERISTIGADEANYFQNCQKSKGDGEPVDLSRVI